MGRLHPLFFPGVVTATARGNDLSIEHFLMFEPKSIQNRILSGGSLHGRRLPHPRSSSCTPQSYISQYLSYNSYSQDSKVPIVPYLDPWARDRGVDFVYAGERPAAWIEYGL